MTTFLYLCGLVGLATSLSIPSNTLHLERDDTLRFQPDDTGFFKNCGGTNFTLSWSPKVISTQGFFTIKLLMTSDFNWGSGYAKYTVTVAGQKLSNTRRLSCSTLSPFTPSPCPFKPGEKVEGMYSGPGSVLQPGITAEIKVEFMDENKKTLLCAEGEVTTSVMEIDLL